jgi:hypothetical protein
MERCRDTLQHLTLKELEQLRGRKHLLRRIGDEVLEIRESQGYCLLGKTKADLNNVRDHSTVMNALEPDLL